MFISSINVFIYSMKFFLYLSLYYSLCVIHSVKAFEVEKANSSSCHCLFPSAKCSISMLHKDCIICTLLLSSFYTKEMESQRDEVICPSSRGFGYISFPGSSFFPGKWEGPFLTLLQWGSLVTRNDQSGTSRIGLCHHCVMHDVSDEAWNRWYKTLQGSKSAPHQQDARIFVAWDS